MQGKSLHRSIEVPLKLYCANGVKVVDVMSTKNKKNIKLKKIT